MYCIKRIQKEKTPRISRKFFAGNSRGRGSSRLQVRGSVVGLPSRGETEVRDAATIAPAADAQPKGTELTDEDTEAVRIEVGTPHVAILEKPLVGVQVVTHDGIDHHLGSRRLVLVGEKSLLLLIGLVGRVVDRRFLDEIPSHVSTILGEVLVVIPVLVVEDLGGHLATNVDDGEWEDGDENVGVLLPFELRFGERNLGEEDELSSRGIDPEVLHRLFDTEEVLSHDAPCHFLARARLETSVFDEPHHLHGEVISFGVDELLGESVVQTCCFELEEHLVLFVYRQFVLAYDVRHRTPPS